MVTLDLLVQGLVQGSIYALIAVGLTLVYGLLRILHIAHAAIFALGGYLGVLVANASGSFPLALAISVIAVGLFCPVVFRFVYQANINTPPHLQLIASVGN